MSLVFGRIWVGNENVVVLWVNELKAISDAFDEAMKRFW